MAERIVRQLIDDLDSTEIPEGGGERVEFSLRGVDYQIDLSAANVAKLDKALKPYIDAAMKLRGTRGGRAKAAGRGTAMSKEHLAAIRDWARKNGYEVSDRGRIRAEIVEALSGRTLGHQPSRDKRDETQEVGSSFAGPARLPAGDDLETIMKPLPGWTLMSARSPVRPHHRTSRLLRCLQQFHSGSTRAKSGFSATSWPQEPLSIAKLGKALAVPFLFYTPIHAATREPVVALGWSLFSGAGQRPSTSAIHAR